VSGVLQCLENLIKEEPFDKFLEVHEKFWLSGEVIHHLVEQKLIRLAHALQS
jgi:hypothetical protein